MKNLLLYIITLFLILGTYASYSKTITDDFTYNEETKYILRLKNGDVLSGYIVELKKDSIKGYVKFETLLGSPKIFIKEISSIREYQSNFKHHNRIFLMPTAEPIGSNFFIGNYDLMFFYGGFGFTDYFSMTIGRTLVPLLYKGQQATVYNVKSTLLTTYYDNVEGHFSIAVGGNLAFINESNRFSHFYSAFSFTLKRSIFTADIFYKVGGSEFYDIAFNEFVYPTYYPGGSFGVGMGIDTKFSERHNLFFTAEVWNRDINYFSDSFFTLGLRMENENVSSEAGLMLFTRPYIIPYLSFIWSP